MLWIIKKIEKIMMDVRAMNLRMEKRACMYFCSFSSNRDNKAAIIPKIAMQHLYKLKQRLSLGKNVFVKYQV